jgi:GWxTD domain-containing protein
MNRIIIVGIAVVVLVISVSARAQVERLVGEGDFETYLDAVGLRVENGKTRQYIFVGVPDKVLRWEKEKSVEKARIRFGIDLEGPRGTVFQDAEDFTFQRRDGRGVEAAIRTRLIRRSVDLPPGTYRLSYKVEDLLAPRQDLLGRIQDAHEESGIEDLLVRVDGFEANRLTFSEPLFCVGSRVDGAPRTPDDVVPYPSREFGIATDSLRALVTAYLPPELEGEDLRVHYHVRDAAGGQVLSDSLIVEGGSLARPFLLRLDVSRLAAGPHALVLRAYGAGQMAERRGGFDVVWDLRTLFRERHDILAEARILLSHKDFTDFKEMEPGEQEAYMRKFWRELDPTPHTALNETYRLFKARLFYADRHFGGTYRGALSDRGIVFIRFGMPSEILADDIPLNRESTKEALELIEDKYATYVNTVTPDQASYSYKSVRRPRIESEARRLGMAGGGNDAGAFEVWVYEMSGDPLLPRDSNLNRDMGMRFVFIDNRGFGEYRMETNSIGLEF